MKEDLQKLLSKADADKFTIYAESISKEETSDAPTTSDSTLVIYLLSCSSLSKSYFIFKFLAAKSTAKRIQL